MKFLIINEKDIHIIILISVLIFLFGYFISVFLRKIKFKHKSIIFKHEDLIIGLIFFILANFVFIFQYVFKIDIDLTGYILFITISSIGFCIIIYFAYLNIKELKYKFYILQKEKILFNQIKNKIIKLPKKKLYTTDQVAEVTGISRVIIKKYERELIRYTVMFSKFGDDLYTKEEAELFIITDFLIKHKDMEIEKVKIKIIDYARQFKDLKIFKSMKK